MSRDTEDIVTLASSTIEDRSSTEPEAGDQDHDEEHDEDPTRAHTTVIAEVAPARFHIEKLIGRGGMGDVFSAFDEQIRRSVAVKRLRALRPSPHATARFLREARIQGRLEHPAVVPVHAVSLAGEPFFVMKQLVGVTLADVLESGADHPELTRQRLLRAFADVCLAVEFAHARGVVHRDLKPANIMLGDFGEVYVLDWGIARIVGDDREFADIDTLEPSAPATIIGTPGYMSPEQVRGELAGTPTDVYALGCILFEILAGRPLHPRGAAALASTLAALDTRPSQHAPDREVPPELDATCAAATALDPAARVPSARALGDAVQRFLDGDRDLSLRSELARRELALAHEALAEGSSPEHRDQAIRAAARALALDPRGREAAELLGRLMLEAPDETPREAELELEARDREAMSLQARLGSWALASYVVFFPVMYLAGFREVWFHAVGLVGVAFAVACARLLARHPTPGMVALSLASNAAIVAFFSRFLTPFLVAPSLGAITAIWFAIHPRGGRTWVLIVVMLAGVLGPWGLEVAGVLSPTTSIDGNRLVLETDAAVRMHPAITLGALALFTAAMVIMVAVMSRSQARSRHQAERRLHSHAWRLRRLVVPEESAHRAAA